MLILTNAWKLLLSSIILLCNIFLGWKYGGEQFGATSIKLLIESRKIRLSKKTGCSDFRSMCSATICSAETSSAKSDGPVSKTEGSRISGTSDKSSEMTMVGSDDWRTPLIRYLKNPAHIIDRKVQHQDLKYVILDNTIYQWTIDDLLLKCLGSDESKIAMEEVHEGICGTHQSAHKMKWLLYRARFFWPTTI
jgi:hypothetical protein